MQECGSSLLKALQNDSMVPLDLLVRECIQNSLDAAKDGFPVRVSFDFVTHEPSVVASMLAGPVGRGLRERFGTGPQRLLVIRDTNTHGLTGPVSIAALRPGDPHGNFMKLVYEVGRSQENSSKGGSWGLGKTVYFRSGIGLVLYYSCIKANGGAFQERLAACLVEDERSPMRLQPDSSTGIAWWGDGEDGPVLSAPAIHDVLQKLNIKKFSGDETGTVVIVPFLREDLGPPGEDADEQDSPPVTPTAIPWWHRTYSAYVNVAVQRWYGIRLNNKRFAHGPPLEVFVDGKRIDDAEVLPIFRLARQLYQCCGTADVRQVVPGAGNTQIQVEVHQIGPLNVALDGTQVAGRVASSLVTHEQLGMTPPHNHPSPHLLLTGRSVVGSTAPIVAFLRGHGMIIRWDDQGDSEGWAKGTGTVPEGSYLVAVVVPDGQRRLHDKVVTALKLPPGPERTLESYLRSCEKADHYQWTEPVQVTIVQRMRKRVAEKLKQAVPQVMQSAPVSVPFFAARTIADRLLPEGFGTDGRSGPGSLDVQPSDAPGKKRAALPSLEVIRIRYEAGGLSVDWRLTWARKPSPCTLRLLVDTETRPVTRETWISDGLGQFPFVIERVTAKFLSGDWSVSHVVLADLPGVGLSPKGSKALGGLVVEGTLDVAVRHPQGARIRAALAVEGAALGSRKAA